NRTLFRPELVFPDEALDADVVIAGEEHLGNAIPDRPENAGHLIELLTGERRDAVLHVPEQHKSVRIRLVDHFQEAFEPVGTPAPEMQPVRTEVGLDPEVEVGDDEQALFSFDHERRAITDKFQFHNSLTNPFWGW